LEYVDWELVVVFVFGDFVGRCRDSLRDVGVDHVESGVYYCCSGFDLG